MARLRHRLRTRRRLPSRAALSSAASLTYGCRFRVVQLASGLTLSIAGVFKEVLTILASVILLGERLTLFNAAGLAVCLAGIGGYQRLRLAEARLAALAAPPDGGDECEPVMGMGTGGGDDGDEAAEERSPSVPTAETRALADAVHTK